MSLQIFNTIQVPVRVCNSYLAAVCLPGVICGTGGLKSASSLLVVPDLSSLVTPVLLQSTAATGHSLGIPHSINYELSKFVHNKGYFPNGFLFNLSSL